jgi:hypothetical protein
MTAMTMEMIAPQYGAQRLFDYYQHVKEQSLT